MKTKLQRFALSASQVQPKHVKTAVILISLLLFLLGAGAPDDGSGWPN